MESSGIMYLEVSEELCLMCNESLLGGKGGGEISLGGIIGLESLIRYYD